MSPADLDAGLFVGISQGGEHCNQLVRFTLDDGTTFFAKVVEGTDVSEMEIFTCAILIILLDGFQGNPNDVIASKGVFDAFSTPLSVGLIQNVKWTLCSRSGVC